MISLHGVSQRVATVRPAGAQRRLCVAVEAKAGGAGGFGRSQAKKKDEFRTHRNINVNEEVTGAAPAPAAPTPAAVAAPSGVKGTVATPGKGNWTTVVAEPIEQWFAKAGKNVKLIQLQAGKNLVLYLHKGVVYCSNVESTAYRFPLVDGEVSDSPKGGAQVRVPLDGTVYDLATGEVYEWCPKSANPVQNFLGMLKKDQPRVPLEVFPTAVMPDGSLKIKLTA